MDELCFYQGCAEIALFECGWCHEQFCLLHIIDENEDGRHGDEQMLTCVNCAPFNVYGMLDKD